MPYSVGRRAGIRQWLKSHEGGVSARPRHMWNVIFSHVRVYVNSNKFILYFKLFCIAYAKDYAHVRVNYLCTVHIYTIIACKRVSIVLYSL
jgi:hypothetical protein